MPKQQLIWTAVPNGIAGVGTDRKLRISVCVSPRLRFDNGEDGTLGAFRDLVDWPQRLEQGRVAFDVVIDDGARELQRPVRAAVVTREQPDSALWRAFFDDNTFVRSHAPHQLDEPTVPNPTTALAKHVGDAYTTIGRRSPFRPIDRGAFAEQFPGVVRALEPQGDLGRPLTGEEVRAALAIDDAQLVNAHSVIGEQLLRLATHSSLDERLGAATQIAGRLARLGSAPGGVPIVARTERPDSAVTQFAAFHRSVPAVLRAGPPAAGAVRSADDDRVDFHQIVSACGQYPTLLRRLGLVIDLEIPATAIPSSLFGEKKRLRVIPAFTPAAPDTAYSPGTRYIFDERRDARTFPFPVFAAAPRRSAQPLGPDPLPDLEIVAGLLNLGLVDERVNQYRLVQFDVDAAMKKVINFIRDHLSDGDGQPGDRADKPGAPALRTTGLSLLRANHDAEVCAGMSRAAAHEDDMARGQIASLFAEDLVRGYRVDVQRFPRHFDASRDASPSWMSLHRRRGALSIQQRDGTVRASLAIADEGFVQPAIVQDPVDPNATTAFRPMRIHESLCHWQGWSLSAPPPVPGVTLAGAEAPEPTADNNAAGRTVKSTFEVEAGSLTRLRFGNAYQMRARVVDLAGNGPTGDEADAMLAAIAASQTRLPLLPFDRDKLSAANGDESESLYRRYEPLTPPELVPREELTEGETFDVMVIRSDGQSTAEYAASLGDPKYHGTSDRHVVPPKATQAFVEAHGFLDDAFGAGGNAAAIFSMCNRGDGSLNDPFVTNLDTGDPEPLADVVINGGAGAERRIPHGVRFVRASSPLQATATPQDPQDRTNGYTIHYEEQLRLPYLPDPLARGAALFGLPGVRNQTLFLEEKTAGRDTGELVVLDSTRQVLPQTAIDQLGFVTKIGFPALGRWPEVQPFRLRLDGTAPDTPFAAPTWTEEGQAKARVLTVRLAPGRTQTVWVSVYPDPADVPLFALHFLTRDATQTEGARHPRRMAPHGALAMISPARKLTLVHATQRPMMAPRSDPSTPFAARRLAARDTAAFIGGTVTIHRPSTQKLDIVARWTEQGRGPDGHLPTTTTTHVLELPIHPEGLEVTPLGNSMPIARYPREEGDDDKVDVTFLAPFVDSRPEHASKRWLSRHEFGDTRYRKVTYEIIATTRYREYFPARIVEQPGALTRTTTVADVIIHSSARPPAPEITRIVPSFGWSDLADGTKVLESKRAGGGLRLYLGRSWHASGDDERLAVVGTIAVGSDPLHASAIGQVRPTPDAAQPGTPADVFPYQVHYDEVGLEWYCDITFDVAGAYFPFISFHVARFQEHSLSNLHLSDRVYAGIHQLAPNRTVLFKYFDVDGHHELERIAIQVQGARPSTSRLDVQLETRDVALPDPNLGWTLAAAAQQPVAQTTPLSAPNLWSGELVLPRRRAGERRLAVREFELFPPNTCAPGQAPIDDGDRAHSARLVYADTIRL